MATIITNKVPFMVKLIAIFYYLYALYYILIGILTLAASGFVINEYFKENAVTNFINRLPIENYVSISILLFMFIVFLVLGLIYYFIGRGLSKGNNFARYIVILFAIIDVILLIFVFMNDGIFTKDVVLFIINAFIALYLMFSTSVRASFR